MICKNIDLMEKEIIEEYYYKYSSSIRTPLLLEIESGSKVNQRPDAERRTNATLWYESSIQEQR
jgi:hypothetical protein